MMLDAVSSSNSAVILRIPPFFFTLYSIGKNSGSSISGKSAASSTLSKKTLASEKIMNTDGHTIDGYKHPIFCGDLKEAVTLFDRNVLTIDLNDKGAGLWDKDMTGIKVRDRFDVQPVDKGAVIKGQITEVING